MRRALPLLLTAVLTAPSSGAPPPLAAQEPDSSSRPEATLDQRAMDWIGLLQRERFDSAAAGVAAAVSDQLDADALRSGWEQITDRFGSLDALEPGSRGTQGGYEVVNLVGTFGEADLTVRVVYDEAREIVGFFVLPPGGGEGRA